MGYEWYAAGQFSRAHAVAAYQEDCYKQACVCLGPDKSTGAEKAV